MPDFCAESLEDEVAHSSRGSGPDDSEDDENSASLQGHHYFLQLRKISE